VAGQPVSCAGHWVGNAGHFVAVGGQAVALGGQTVTVAGQVVAATGTIVTTGTGATPAFWSSTVISVKTSKKLAICSRTYRPSSFS